MNRDEQFEQRLRRQPVKPIPPEWREQILQPAHAASHATRNPQPDSRSLLVALWQRLVWPHSKAWGGLAAVWLVIFGLNFAARESTPHHEARLETAPGPELRRLLKQQELLFAELMQGPLAREAEPPKPAAPRPHSQRRDYFVTT